MMQRLMEIQVVKCALIPAVQVLGFVADKGWKRVSDILRHEVGARDECMRARWRGGGRRLHPPWSRSRTGGP